MGDAGNSPRGLLAKRNGRSGVLLRDSVDRAIDGTLRSRNSTVYQSITSARSADHGAQRREPVEVITP